MSELVYAVPTQNIAVASFNSPMFVNQQEILSFEAGLPLAFKTFCAGLDPVYSHSTFVPATSPVLSCPPSPLFTTAPQVIYSNAPVSVVSTSPANVKMSAFPYEKESQFTFEDIAPASEYDYEGAESDSEIVLTDNEWDSESDHETGEELEGVFAYIKAFGKHKAYNGDAIREVMQDENLSYDEAILLEEEVRSLLFQAQCEVNRLTEVFSYCDENMMTTLLSFANQAEDSTMFLQFIMSQNYCNPNNELEVQEFSAFYRCYKFLEAMGDMVRVGDDDEQGRKQRLIERVERLIQLFFNDNCVKDDEMRGKQILMLPCTSEQRLLEIIPALADVSFATTINRIALRNSVKSKSQRKGFTLFVELVDTKDLNQAKMMFEQFNLKVKITNH